VSSFHEWICHQAHRADPVGALCHDAWESPDWPGFPHEADSKATEAKYLSYYQDEPWMLTAFEAAWSEYLSTAGTESRDAA
jgi:hypothetical protein